MANITKVYLLSVPLEEDYKDTLYFANATAQHNYFAGQVVKSYTDFSYQRKDSLIRVPALVDSIRNCNYVMYQNSAYSNKWFYAFINRMVYVDDGRTDIYISTDVMQTWMFEMNIKDSFIEREHVNDDTIGLHTMPEHLEAGEYICNDILDFRFANTQSFPHSINKATMMVVVQVSSLVVDYKKQEDQQGYTHYQPYHYFNSPTWNIINSIPQGLSVICIPVCEECLGGVYQLIGMYDSAGRSDCIQSMFLLPMQSSWGLTPYTFTSAGTSTVSDTFFYPTTSTGPTNNIFNIDDTTQSKLDIPINTTIDGYTPKNNKLFIGDYNYFSISNNDGVIIPFKYEDFYSTPSFNFIASFEQGGSFMCLPTNSKKTASNNTQTDKGWTEGIPGGKFPLLSWVSDYYLNWQAQNFKYIETSMVLGGIDLGATMTTGMIGGATGRGNLYDSAYQSAEAFKSANPGNQIGYANRMFQADMVPQANPVDAFSSIANPVMNFAGQCASALQQEKQARMAPQQAKGNASTGTLSYACNEVGKYTARKMTIRAEYARAIDSYFQMFGYKVNRLGIPLKNHRENWWFTKTIHANIDGNIPNEDMSVIKRIYDNGVTFWKNPANIKNYNVSNNIV